MKEQTSKITDLLALAVFAVFAVCVLSVLLGGAKVYQQVVRRTEESFQNRIAAQYVTARIQQAADFSLEDFEGCDALVIPEELEGEVYLTRVYCYGGYIRELYCSQNAALSPEDGEKVLPAQSLTLELRGSLLTAQVDGRQVLVHRPAGQEVSP